EKVVFPFIKAIEDGTQEGYFSGGKSVEEPVKMMLDDHKEVAAHVHAIENLSDGYTVPADGCDSYRLYFHKLKALDNDLHLHIHLENNVLFPKAIKKQKEGAY